ncbi:MAG TPA: metallophosphoesterase [Acidobacteriota bacterium]|nr:metallophosphoesterase [Acidobacteriota bacterium]
MSLIIALATGRCAYSIEDGGYDLSRFRDDPALTSVPDDLRGLVATNAEAARAVAARPDGGRLRFVVIGDTISDKNRTFRTFLGEIATLEPRPAFIVHLGDRVVSPVVDYYGTYLKVIADPPCPVLHVDGNHDVREEGERIARAFFGEKDFFFDKDGVRFVFMSNVRPTGRPGFSREQLAWLEAVLKAPSPARKFFFAHVPPKEPFRKFHPGLAAFFTPRLENEAEFLELLARHHVALAAFGHRHVHATTIHKGVLMAITGGGGQRNFLEPNVKEPLFTKKRHYTLVDIPASEPFEPFEGVLACVGKGHETLFASTFVQPSLLAAGDLSVELRPWPAAAGAFLAAPPAWTRLGVSSRTP